MRRLWKAVPVFVGVGLLLAGFALGGRAAAKHLQIRDRYAVDFLAIRCTPAPSQGQADFLSEVQYLAGMPSRLPLLDRGLPGKLAEAFASHPWVEKVERVEVGRAGRVGVRLVFRTPTLAVSVGNRVRAVDRHGILLPPSAETCGLPLFAGPAKPPLGPAGTRWGDAAVEDAAKGRVTGLTWRKTGRPSAPGSAETSG